jgi:hypothetical protein
LQPQSDERKLPGLGIDKIRVHVFCNVFGRSGKLTNPKSDFVVLAGIILGAGEEGVFNQGWHRILKDHAERNKLPNPKYFHATEALRSVGHFSDWSESAAHSLALELAKFSQSLAYRVVAAPANKSEFKSLPEDFRRTLNGVNELSFEACLYGAMAEIGDNGEMGVMCDDEEREAMEMYQLLCKFKRRNPVGGKRIVSVCFADDKSYPPLQCADLFAYACRLEEDRKRDSPESAPGEIYRAFVQSETTVRIFRWPKSETGPGSALVVTS